MKITMSNFRCFDDEAPAEIELRQGFTAIVGPNNAGKSSILRSLFELRDLFGRISDTGTVIEFLRNHRIGIPIRNVPDASVLQCDSNNRPMSIRIECLGIEDPAAISAIEVTFTREQPSAAAARLFAGPHFAEIPASDDATALDANLVRVQGRQFGLSEFRSETSALIGTLYVGPFRNILNQGAAEYFDLSVGTAFVNIWNNWKNGDIRANCHAIKRVEDAIGHLFGYKRLEINPSIDRSRLRVFIDGQSFDLHDQGSGLAQFVVTFGAAATRQPSLILIDEPESNLHPSLQIDFLTTLGTFASHGVVFSTHTIGLARSVADRIYSVQRLGHRSVMQLYEETPNLTEFAGELSFSAYRDFGYDRLLLVEGPTDVRTYQQFLRKLNKDRRVVIFPLIGHAFASGKHSEALIELIRVAPANQIFAIVDSERRGVSEPCDPRRTAFKNACDGLGITAHLTDRRAIENYFPSHAIHQALGGSFESLEPFEKHGEPPKNWKKSLNWKVAHAMDLQDLRNTDLLGVLESL